MTWGQTATARGYRTYGLRPRVFAMGALLCTVPWIRWQVSSGRLPCTAVDAPYHGQPVVPRLDVPVSVGLQGPSSAAAAAEKCGADLGMAYGFLSALFDEPLEHDPAAVLATLGVRRFAVLVTMPARWHALRFEPESITMRTADRQSRPGINSCCCFIHESDLS